MLLFSSINRPGRPSIKPSPSSYFVIYCHILSYRHIVISSHDGNVVHGARAPLHDHVGELRHLDLRVLAPLHQVHDGQRRALRHGAPPLPVAAVAAARRLLAAPGAPVRLVAGGLDDPVLGPGERAEVDEVLLAAARVTALVVVGLAVAAGTEEEEEEDLLDATPRLL